jgi:hypothetical protein
MTPCYAVRIVGITLSMSGAASMAAGQDQSVHPLPAIPAVQTRVPLLTVGGGFGVDATEAPALPLQMLAVQYHVRRNLIVAGDVTHLSIPISFFGRSVTSPEWATAADLLYSTGPRRVTAFVGGGGAVTRRDSFEPGVTCMGQPAHCASSTRLDGSVHVTTGANVRVAGPIYAFTLMRLSTDDSFLKFVGGVRVAVATKDR